MGSNDMLLQPDADHMFTQQTDGTYYNDNSQQQLVSVLPMLIFGSVHFILFLMVSIFVVAGYGKFHWA